jgi:dUTP pyrophosphatase
MPEDTPLSSLDELRELADDLMERLNTTATVRLTPVADDVVLPVRKHATDSGADVRWYARAEANEAELMQDVHGERYYTLAPGERRMFTTGLTVASISPGYEVQVRPRSGLALKQGVTVLNTPGTVDEGYRGPLNVILVNHSHEPQVIRDGDRIAQLVVAAYEPAAFEFASADEIEDSDRGAGGFGSTGR